MAEIDIKDRNNSLVGKLTLPDHVFWSKCNKGTIHNSVVNYLANQRQGTHATKTKGLVSGGGKKPWKQKHTGRARAGSSRSPLWRGGGIVFGPQPRDYGYSLPKKVKKAALFGILSLKYADGEVTVIDNINIDKPRTKEICTLLKGLGIEGKSTLIVLPEKDENIMLSARNVQGVDVIRVNDLNTYAAAVHNVLLITKRAAEMLGEAGQK